MNKKKLILLIVGIVIAVAAVTVLVICLKSGNLLGSIQEGPGD